MKNIVSTLTITALCLFCSALAKAETTKHYNLSFNGQGAVPTTIHWKNISGLDSIRGVFHYEAGEMYFSGKNSHPGFIYLKTETGLYMEFRRQSSGSGFVWVKQGHGDFEVLTPTTINSHQPASCSTVRGYGGNVGKKNASMKLHWANISGLGKITGQMYVIENGNRVVWNINLKTAMRL